MGMGGEIVFPEAEDGPTVMPEGAGDEFVARRIPRQLLRPKRLAAPRTTKWNFLTQRRRGRRGGMLRVESLRGRFNPGRAAPQIRCGNPRYQDKVHLIRATHRCGFFARSCSHKRTRRQPSCRSLRVTNLSRATLLRSFSVQNCLPERDREWTRRACELHEEEVGAHESARSGSFARRGAEAAEGVCLVLNR